MPSSPENPLETAVFYAKFPEFVGVYQPSQVEFWVAQSYNNINIERLGKNLDLAIMFWVAHQLIVFKKAAASVSAGGGVGSTGLIASKSVDKVSISYDNTSGLVKGAENYNLTPYGQMFWRLLRAACSGMVYVRSGRPTSRVPW
jgi:hypothetical protein